jgi:hypothetical protein
MRKEKGPLCRWLWCGRNRAKEARDVSSFIGARRRRAPRPLTISAPAPAGHDRVHGPPFSAGAGWTPLTCALAALLMGWDPAPTLAQRFESALAVLDAALPRRRRTGRTYQGFVKALARHGDAALGTLVAHLRGLTQEAAGAAWKIGEFIPLGADGSRFDAPRTIGNEPLGFAGKDKCGPQMMTLLLVHLGAMLPWAWKAGAARDAERPMLREMLGLLPRDTLLVADAGFTGFDLLSDLHGRGLHFLVRVGRGVRLLQRLGYYRREGAHTVYLWPDQKHAQPPLTLRLVRLGAVYLITNVLESRRLSKAMAGDLYRRRWGLEVAFRSLKQTLERRRVRSGAAAHARAELDWAVAGLWVLTLLGVRAIAAAGHGPRRLSLAGVIAAVRAARVRPMTDAALRRRLGRAVQDSCRRRSSKHAYRRARKKNPQPPGPPRLTIATAAQVRDAQRLRSQLHAA